MVAQTKSRAYNEIYDEQGTKEGLNKVLKLSMARNENTKDIPHIMQIKDRNGTVLRKEEDILKRWRVF